MTNIHQDMRTKLDKRFKAAIKYLMEEGTLIKSTQGDGISYGELATILFGDGAGASTFSLIMKGHRLANFPEAILLAEEFGFNVLWMVTGQGNMLNEVTNTDVPGPSQN